MLSANFCKISAVPASIKLYAHHDTASGNRAFGMDVLPLFAYDEIGNIVRESTNASTAVDLSSDPLRDKYISASRTSGYHLENYLDDEVFKFVIPLISSEATRSALNACILVKGDCIVGAYAERRGSSPEILSLKEASAELNSDN